MALYNNSTYIQSNIRSYYANLLFLQKIMDKYNPIIVALQETCLHNDVRYRGYQAIRKDRVTRGLRGEEWHCLLETMSHSHAIK